MDVPLRDGQMIRCFRAHLDAAKKVIHKNSAIFRTIFPSNINLSLKLRGNQMGIKWRCGAMTTLIRNLNDRRHEFDSASRIAALWPLNRAFLQNRHAGNQMTE
jgi:hypothetical protein